jgi:hypothetical protein
MLGKRRMDVELPHFWILKSTVRFPEQEAMVASKSFCIFRSLVLVAPLLVFLVLAATNDEENVLKTVGGISQSLNHHDIQRVDRPSQRIGLE